MTVEILADLLRDAAVPMKCPKSWRSAAGNPYGRLRIADRLSSNV